MAGGLPAVNVTLPQGAAPLRMDQPVQTVVRADASGGRFIQLAGQRIPLPADSPLQAGDRVSAQLSGGRAAPQLQITLLASAPSSPASGLASLLSRLAPQLALEGDAPSGAQMLPSALLAHPAQGAAVLALLLGDEGPGSAWSSVMQWLAAGKAAQRLSPGSAAESLLQQLATLEPGWEEALRLTAKDTRLEARLAAMDAKIQQRMPEGLRPLIAGLLEDEAFKGFLQERGALGAFEKSTGEILSRLDAAAAANLRGLDQSYRFLEFPLALLLGFDRAQVHWFGDGSTGKSRGKRHDAALVLDLAVEPLGELWVQLSRSNSTTRCEVCAARPESRELIEAGKEALRDALADAGLPNPQVLVRDWLPTERAARLAALFMPPRPLDLGA